MKLINLFLINALIILNINPGIMQAKQWIGNVYDDPKLADFYSMYFIAIVFIWNLGYIPKVFYVKYRLSGRFLLPFLTCGLFMPCCNETKNTLNIRDFKLVLKQILRIEYNYGFCPYGIKAPLKSTESKL